MTYSEKLKDPRWQKKRLEILQRDEFTCQHCLKSDKTLHVHHTYYNGKDPWETHDSRLVTLCEDCHEKEDEKFEFASAKLIECIKESGLTSYSLYGLSYLVTFMKDRDWRRDLTFQILNMCVEDDEIWELALKKLEEEAQQYAKTSKK